MRAAGPRPTVWTVVFDDFPGILNERPPPAVRVLRGFGVAVVVFVAVANVLVEPRPGLSGDGLWVSVSLVAMVAGLAVILVRRPLPRGRRLAGLVTVAAASCVLTGLHPDSGSVAGIYVVVIIAALRLRWPAAYVVAGLAIAAETAVLALTADQFEGSEIAFLSSVVPWFFVMRLIRSLHESRLAQVEAAALAERGRLARDMHDVLAHTLSALALQLEATRLLARDRGADPEVVDAVEHAHRLAAGGLDEARRAIAALRGDELPGPERLEALAEAFSAESDATCTVTVAGEPRPLDADAGLTLYRAAQEALTNVRRHSSADRVEIRLAYERDGVDLVVSDNGNGASPAGGEGYGLTGMRERAELLGGRLSAGPTADGYRVELWLPR
jgi:signal transduction histidine kinase